jgi:hypothetical protein
MSLLKTMIKHTAGGQEASAGFETPSLPPQPPQPAIYVSTGLGIHDIEDARDWPEDREIDGTLCRRLSPEYFAWLRSRMVTAQTAHKAGKLPDDAWNTLRQPSGSLARKACRRYCSPFPRKTIGHPCFVPSPWRNLSKFPERTGFIPATKLGNVSSR